MRKRQQNSFRHSKNDSSKFISTPRNEHQRLLLQQWNDCTICATSSVKQVQQFVDALLENTNLYPLELLEMKQCIFVLYSLCQYLQENHNDLLASKICQLITLIISKQQSFDVASISSSLQTQFVQIVESLHQLLLKSHSWLLVDVLRSLCILFYSFKHLLSKNLLQTITQVILPMAKLTNSDVHVRRQAICVLSNLCTSTCPLESQTTTQIWQILQQSFELYSKNIFLDFGLLKLLLTTIYALENCLQCFKPNTLINPCQDIIPFVKNLLFYGTKWMPQPPLQSTTLEYDSASDSASDSDHSDTETMDSFMSKEVITLRLAAFALLSSIAKTNFKAVFAQFKILIPSSDALEKLPKTNPSLSTLILYDSIARCRSAALQTLQDTLCNSQLYLAQASDVSSKSSFISFSATLASMIVELHRTLMASLVCEKSIQTQVHTFKCFATLISNTPYNKVSKLLTSILPSLLEQLTFFLKSTEKVVQSGAMLCMNSLFSLKKEHFQIWEPLLGIYQKEWMEILLNHFEKGNSLNAKIDAAQLLSSIAQCYPLAILNFWERVLQLVKQNLHFTNEQTLRLSSIQIIANLTSYEAEEQNMEESFAYSLREDINQTVWNQIITEIIEKASRDEYQAVKASIATTYSHIPHSMFLSFDKNRIDNIVSHLFTLSKDSAASVRAAVLRCFGIISQYEPLRDNLAFLNQFIQMIDRLVNDTTVNVKGKLIWCVANLCDFIRKSSCVHVADSIPLLYQFGYFCLLFCNENDKIRCNSMRAIGNLLSIPKHEAFEKSIFYCNNSYTLQVQQEANTNSMFNAFIKELYKGVQDHSHLKSCWNACYGASLLFSNSSLLVPIEQEAKIVDELCCLLQRESNFKIRIQAASALKAVVSSERKKYCMAIAQAVIHAIVNIKNFSDFKEYKYVESLSTNLRQLLGLLIIGSNPLQNDEKWKSLVQDKKVEICEFLQRGEDEEYLQELCQRIQQL